jgi:hypothetical protein
MSVARMIIEMPSASLLENPQVWSSYLGHSASEFRQYFDDLTLGQATSYPIHPKLRRTSCTY